LIKYFGIKEGGPMYWRNNNGGWNKSHGTVEKTPRIDSYEAGTVEGWGSLFAYREKGLPLVLDCNRYMEYGPETDREIVEVWHPKNGWSRELELSRKPNGYGGNQAFFLCPTCGQRVRYLYLSGAVFLCRKCSRLNYRSQQETRSDSMFFYGKGIKYAKEHFDIAPGDIPSGFDFTGWIPPRRRYQHGTTYRKHLHRLARYEDKHLEREKRDLLRLFK